jgi:hypothetical protein
MIGSVSIVTAAQSVKMPASKVIAIFDGRSFSHPIRLPKQVLDALLRDVHTSYAQDWSKDHPKGDLNQFFVATTAHIAQSDEVDWVVEGQAPLTGADCNWFWIVRDEPAGPRVVLFYNGYTLRIHAHRTNGLSDVSAVWESPNERSTSEYRYDGMGYKLIRKYWKGK